MQLCAKSWPNSHFPHGIRVSVTHGVYCSDPDTDRKACAKAFLAESDSTGSGLRMKQ